MVFGNFLRGVKMLNAAVTIFPTATRNKLLTDSTVNRAINKAFAVLEEECLHFGFSDFVFVVNDVSLF